MTSEKRPLIYREWWVFPIMIAIAVFPWFVAVIAVYLFAWPLGLNGIFGGAWLAISVVAHLLFASGAAYLMSSRDRRKNVGVAASRRA